jgi:hypothetical protein
VALQLRNTVGSMVAPAPIGAPAGFLEVSLRCGCISIADSETSQAEQFADLQSAARALFHLVVKRFIAARPDLLWIHAGVVAYARRALLFSAASGQGKSTLVAELLARGWGYLSDEIAPVDPVSGTVYPFPIAPYRRVSRQPNLPAAEVRRLPKVRVDVAQGAVRTAAVPLAGVYFLSYSPHTRAVELADSSPGTAVVDMLLHSLSSSESREMEIRGLSQLMTRVPTAYLRYANARDAAEQIAMVHEAMGPTSAELATQRILSAHSSEALDIFAHYCNCATRLSTPPKQQA